MEKIFRPNAFQYFREHVLDYGGLLNLIVLFVLFVMYLSMIEPDPIGMELFTPLFILIMICGSITSFAILFALGIWMENTTKITISPDVVTYISRKKEIKANTQEITEVQIREKLPDFVTLMKTDLPGYTTGDAIRETLSRNGRPKLQAAYKQALSNKLGYTYTDNLGYSWLEIKTANNLTLIPMDNFDRKTKQAISEELSKLIS